MDRMKAGPKKRVKKGLEDDETDDDDTDDEKKKKEIEKGVPHHKWGSLDSIVPTE